MKRQLLSLMLIFCCALMVNAQTWNATDWQGNSHDLSMYNTAGTATLVDISAHWCGPCWGWHQSGVMEDLYHDFGPDGTGEFMVFFIDGDAQSSVALLQGGAGSQGDWTAGTYYPLIGPNGQGSAVAGNYSFGGYPTLFLHCGAGTAPEIARADKWAFWGNVMQMCPTSFQAESVDATLLIPDGPSYICQGSAVMSVNVYNAGTTALTSFDVELRDPNGMLVHTQNVSGMNIAHGEHSAIDIQYAASAAGTYSATVVNPNGQADPRTAGDTEEIEVIAASAGTGTTITVEIVPDNYGSEITWSVTDHTGAVILSGGPYTDGVTTMESDQITTTGDGCYKFTINDAYGDGICCAYGNGSYTVKMGSDVMVSGGEYASSEEKSFEVDNEPNSTGITSNDIEGSFELFPTVTEEIAVLQMSNIDNASVIIDLYNINGQKIQNLYEGDVNGQHTQQIDLSKVAPGQYLVNIVSGDDQKSMRVVKVD